MEGAWPAQWSHGSISFHSTRIADRKNHFNPFYAMDSELFDFHLFRFSFGETTEEATRKRKSKS
jgi:hypothetical protein